MCKAGEESTPHDEEADDQPTFRRDITALDIFLYLEDLEEFFGDRLDD